MKKHPRILIWDIETLPNMGYFFGIFDQNINPNFIIKEKSIVTIAYKFMGDKKAQSISIADFGKIKDPYDDKKLIKKFLKIMEEADYMVAHFGDGFDHKFLNSRAFLNNLVAPPPVQTIDTYKLAKKTFNLNSNRLDYLGKKLGFGGKMPMDWSYWVKCAEGNLAAIKKMAAYNRQDVDLLEKVFLKLVNSTSSKLNMQIFTQDICCKTCGSMDIQYRGYLHKLTQTVRKFVCNRCGSWGTHKLNVDIGDKL